jgi:hypothetical protein
MRDAYGRSIHVINPVSASFEADRKILRGAHEQLINLWSTMRGAHRDVLATFEKTHKGISIIIYFKSPCHIKNYYFHTHRG